MAIIEFNIPNKITFGNDTIIQISNCVKKYGGRAVIVTNGESFNQTGIIEQITDNLHSNFINVMTYSDIDSNSTSESSDIVANLAKYSRADVIISVGGFKVQNIAKGAAVVVTNSGEASDYVNGQPVYHKPMPVISISTIPGSLSEITTGMCLYDKYNKENKQTSTNNIYASDCIVDPRLYSTIPVKYVISSAMSVFALAFDVYMSKTLTNISEPLIKHSMRLSMKGLSKLMADSANVDNFNTIATANMLCSVSACHSSLGAIRALSIAVNSVYSINMSMFASIILPHIMEYYITVVPDKYTPLADYIEGVDKDMSPLEIASQSAQYIKRFLQNINLPTRLNEFNIDRDYFNEVAKLAMNYPGMESLPRPMSYDAIMTLLDQAY